MSRLTQDPQPGKFEAIVAFVVIVLGSLAVTVVEVATVLARPAAYIILVALAIRALT